MDSTFRLKRNVHNQLSKLTTENIIFLDVVFLLLFCVKYVLNVRPLGSGNIFVLVKRMKGCR